jgi:hypothetical protein
MSILNCNEYTSENPFMKVNEGHGIPNTLKDLFKISIDKVIKSISDNSLISIDFEGNDKNGGLFKITNLYIKLVDKNIKNVYGLSSFGIYSQGILKSPGIEIHFDYTNYDLTEVKRVLLHELLHIYEIFKRSHNKSKKDLQWRLNQILMSIRGNYSDKLINDLCYVIYLSLNQEINARVSETYIVLMEDLTDNKDIILENLYKTSAWKYKNILNDFDYNSYNINYPLLKHFLSELNTKMLLKFPNMNFNLYKIPTSDKECLKILKDWDFLFKKKSKYFENKLIGLIEEVINDVKLINSTYIEDDRSDKLSERFVTKYDVDLYRSSKIFKLLR